MVILLIFVLLFDAKFSLSLNNEEAKSCIQMSGHIQIEPKDVKSWPEFSNDSKTITLAFLYSKDVMTMKIIGAITSSVDDVNKNGILPDDYKLQFKVILY